MSRRLKAAAWTNAWLQELPWGELNNIKKLFDQRPATAGIAAARQRRTEAEWRRRKHPDPGNVSPSQSDISRVMAEMGRRGGRIGGKARAAAMTPEQRTAQALKAATARWRR